MVAGLLRLAGIAGGLLLSACSNDKKPKIENEEKGTASGKPIREKETFMFTGRMLSQGKITTFQLMDGPYKDQEVKCLTCSQTINPEELYKINYITWVEDGIAKIKCNQ